MNTRNGSISRAKTANYRPSVTSLPEWSGAMEGAAFTLIEVDQMRGDAQIELCLEYKVAPLYNAEFEYVARSPQIQQYIQRQVERFWQHSLQIALECLPYGRSGAEVLTRDEGGLTHFHSLEWLHPRDVRVFTCNGTLAYLAVRNVEGCPNLKLYAAQQGKLPECAWFVYGGKRSRWYGRSILFPSWWYWRTKVMPDGANETLYKFFYRHGYNGMVVRYPVDTYQDEDTGQLEYAKDIARQLAQSIKTGADIELPSEQYENGNPKWSIERYGGETNGDATGLIAYIDWLDKQAARGILIPDLILTQEGATGSYSRSQVALTAFFMGAEQILNLVLETFIDQVLRPLVVFNFGPQPFAIKPKPLISQQQQSDQQDGQPGQQPGQPPSMGGQPSQPQGGPSGGGQVHGFMRGGKYVQPYHRQQAHRFSMADIGRVLTTLADGEDAFQGTALDPGPSPNVTFYAGLRRELQQFIDEPGTTRLSGADTEDAGDFQALAQLYADHWNDLTAAGMQISEKQLHDVGEELADGDWMLSHNPQTGQWEVVPAELEGQMQFAVAHAPRGGVTIDGRVFRGGQFIPGAYLADATPEQRAAIISQTPKNNADARRARGSVDPASLRARVAPHQQAAGEANRWEKSYAKRAYAALRRHHGELLHHRLEELIDETEKALSFIDDDHPNADGLRNQFRQRLAAYGQMVDRAEGHGITGKVEPGAVPEQAAEPEEPEIKESVREAEPVAIEPKAMPEIKEQGKKPAANPTALKAHILDTFAELLREKHTVTGLVPIHEIRAAVREKFGDEAGKHAVLDKLMLDLWREKRLKFMSIADRGRATPEQIQDGVPGVGETLFYLEVGPDYTSGGTAAVPEQATEPEEAPEIKESVRKPATKDPLDITPDNVATEWANVRDEIAASDSKLSPALAGHIAAARILNAVGKRAKEYIDDIDARVKRDEPITDEEDAKYIAAQDARKNIYSKLVQESGYRPGTSADDHPEAKKPISGGQVAKPSPSVQDLAAALAKVDSAKGGHNLVHLGDLREELGLDKPAFDSLVTEARKAGVLGLAKGEGRQGYSDRDKAEEHTDATGEKLLYAMKKEGKGTSEKWGQSKETKDFIKDIKVRAAANVKARNDAAAKVKDDVDKAAQAKTREDHDKAFTPSGEDFGPNPQILHGDLVETKDGTTGTMHSSGGMGSDRVKVRDRDGNESWESKSELKLLKRNGIAESLPAVPSIHLADTLAEKLSSGQTITSKDLFDAANTSFGGTRAEGKYGPSDAYDALEAGFNKSLVGKTSPTADLHDAQQQAEEIAKRVQELPTQTNRSGNKDAFQQFSTPPHYAFAAAWLANLSNQDTVLEPSAGTGCLAVQAANTGANVYANELDPKRAEFLKGLLGDDKVHLENAEQISAILPKRGMPAPTAIVMNPPFSQTAGRMGDKKETMTGANHIAEAMQFLAPNGRLVAIVGRGMSPESPTFREWFSKMKGEYNLRANVGVEGEEYKKYGTQFGTRVLVFDKTGPHEGETISGDAESIPDLMAKLEGVRNDRPEVSTSTPTSSEHAGGAATPSGEGTASVTGLPAPATPDRVPGVDTGPDQGAAEQLGERPADGGPRTSEPPDLSASESTAGESGGVRSGSEGSAEPEGSSAGEASGGTAGADEPKADVRRGRKAARGKPVQQPTASRSEFRKPEPVVIEAAKPVPTDQPTGKPDSGPAEPKSNEDLSDSLYESYRPSKLRVQGAKSHTTPLVESAAMSAVNPPDPTYSPTLSPDIVDKGILSDAQLESLIYAGQAHGKFLPTAEGQIPSRRGYFIGDGTGVGKGRQIAGIIADNWNQGRKKHVWVSQKQNLLEDAGRDWGALGMDPEDLVHFDKIRKSETPPKEGVAFITYDTLKGTSKDPTKPSNIDQLVAWLGPDFDGVIAFDEAHGMANATAIEGERGIKNASQKALAGVKLQQMLPKARVTYVSATGATEVSNLAYAERLGLWGRGTAFGTKQEFFEEMDKGGVAAMEAVAQSMKAMGSYGARSLSFDDGTEKGKVTYERLTHKMTEEQKATYDALADGWQSVLQNIDKALESTGGNTSKTAKGNARSQFWGAQQRFFNQVMTSIQTPSVIQAMEKDIAEGRSPVIQLVNTGAAPTERALARREDTEDLESLDVSPRETLMQYLEKSFPVHRHEEFQDDNGNTQTRLVKDSNGEPVVDPKAAAMRDNLLDMVGTLRIPESPLDMIVNHFGHEKVAEATGRTQRLIYQEQDDGTRKRVLERRNTVNANSAEASAFQSGKKKILVFSDAGGTGRSYHADKNAQNQDQRVHYMLQPGWRADNAVQGLGRTHRTNQAVAPTYRLVEIEDLKAQKRFISTIARRLDQLGALTKGQRQAGGGGLFKAADNLESPQANEALGKMFRDLQGGRIEGLHFEEVMGQLGFKTDEDKKKGRKQQGVETPPMGQFLNRLLSLRVDMQGKVFDAFDQRLQKVVEQAVREGTLDTGVENFPANKITKDSDKTIYKDQETGAEARHVVTTVQKKADKRSWNKNLEGEKPIGYVQNKQSGRTWVAYKWIDRTDARTGSVTAQYVLRSPTGAMQVRPISDFSPYGNYEKLDEEKAKKSWDQEYSEAPDHIESEEHFLTGAFLPIWDRIPGDKPKIYRLRTEDGQTVVGRHIPKQQVPQLMKNLGVAHEGKQHKAVDVHAGLSKGTTTKATLANGWSLKPVRVGGERRIELTGPTPFQMGELMQDGVVKERINYDTRFFVPVGEEGSKVMERITRSRPIADVEGDVPKSAQSPVVQETPKPQSPLPEPKLPTPSQPVAETPKPPEPAPNRYFISGNTFTHKDKIKAAGGRWDSNRKGWVIPAAAKAKIEHLSGLRYEGMRLSVAQWDSFLVMCEANE